MNEQQIREIAETAFKHYFGDLELVRVNVKPGFGFDDDSPKVDVKIIYDGKYELLNGERQLRVQADIVDKAWREVADEDDLGFPCVHFIAKSGLGRRDPATV